MVPDRLVKAARDSEALQREMGVVFDKDRETREQYETRLERFIAITLQATKDHSTYWLGLAHADGGKHDVASTWLQQHVVDDETSRWTVGAYYNVARALEGQGELQQARQKLLRDKTHHRHGSIVRARQIKQRLTRKGKDAS